MDEDQPEIVRIKLDGTQRPQPGPATKAFQIKIDDNKTMIVYNRVNSYILGAYDQTIRFYESVGFERLEVFPTLWDTWNPCLVLVKKL